MIEQKIVRVSDYDVDEINSLIAEYNKKGWRVTQVSTNTGFSYSVTILFDKIKKED